MPIKQFFIKSKIKRILLILLAAHLKLIQLGVVFAQDLNNLPFNQSPNAASLGVYGNIKTNQFNGLANISLPVFSLNEGTINVSADLRYFSAGVKPENHPGWVGQNFSLITGGIVNRIPNEAIDEVAILEGSQNTNYAYLYHYNRLNSNNWSGTTYMTNYATLPSNDPSQALPSPDEFQFTLPTGESGSFFLNHLGKWVVKTENEGRFLVAVEVNQSPCRLISTINSSKYIDLERIIYKISIINSEGTKFTFGNNLNSIEFVRYPRLNASSSIYNEDVIANSWHITRIENIQGDIINYSYDRKENIYIQTRDFKNTNLVGGTSLHFCSGFSATSSVFQGSIITPSYLTEIKCKSFKIEFEKSPTTELSYPFDITAFSDFGLYTDMTYTTITSEYRISLSRPVWYKLDAIKVYDKSYKLKEHYSFNYNNNSNERLFLLDFQRNSVEGDNSIKKYSFIYDTTPLPPYNSFNTDQWGYYNAKSPFTTTLQDYMSSNPSVIQAGILQKIIYPTGGFTEFEYELNDFSAIVNKDISGITLVNNVGQGGGLRIRKIIDTDNNGVANWKEYHYKKLSNVTTSSGILGGRKKTAIIKYFNPLAATETLVSLNTLQQLNYTDGNPVTYSEVTEKFSDNSKIEKKFSDFDDPLLMDELPINIVSFAAYTDGQAYATTNSSYSSPFLGHSSKSLERGKLKMEKYYNANGFVVRKIDNHYRSDLQRLNEFVRSYSYYNNNVTCSQWLLGEAYYEAYKIYTYTPFLVKRIETSYNDVGEELHIATRDYLYDYNLNKLVSESFLNSDGKENKIIYRYPEIILSTHPVSSPNVLTDMLEKNIQFPLEKLNISKINGNEFITGGSITSFENKAVTDDDNVTTSKPLLSQIYQLENVQPIAVNNYTTHYINSNGQLVKDDLMKSNIVLTYNNYGDIISTTDANTGLTTSIKYGQNRDYISTEVKNAYGDEFYAENFEEMGTYGYAHTGNRYNLGDYTVVWTKPNSREYIISYWYRTNDTWHYSGE